MSTPFKKRAIKFCPFCGGSTVTHISDDSFMCGTGDAAIDIANRPNCHRVFRVSRGRRYEANGKTARRDFNALMQEQFARDGVPGGRRPSLR